MLRPWILPALLIGVPLLELWLIIEVGSRIGALITVVLIVFTALLGSSLLRHQGLATVNRLRRELDRGHVPAMELMEALVLVVGGVLLLTPGFLTDALGLICLLPWTRRWLVRALLSRAVTVYVAGREGDAEPGAGPRTLEGEFRRDQDERRY